MDTLNAPLPINTLPEQVVPVTGDDDPVQAFIERNIVPAIVRHVEDWYKEDGIIAGVKKGFAPRTGQQELSQLILDEIAAGGHTIAEAPTGFGKSIAVLVPAIIHALSGKRVVVSTETKNLQDQYYTTDLPMMAKALKKHGISLDYAVAKGRSNYLCRDKRDSYWSEIGANRSLGMWAKEQTITRDDGDGNFADAEFTNQEWLEGLAATELSPCESCQYFQGGSSRGNTTKCFYFKSRNVLKAAQIVVSNHTLTLLDASIGAGTLFGEYDVLIVDEAHSFAEKAVDTWGKQLKPHTISKTIAGIDTLLEKSNVHDAFEPGFIHEWKRLEDAIFAPFSEIVKAKKSLPLSDIPAWVLMESMAKANVVIEELGDLYDRFARYVPSRALNLDGDAPMALSTEETAYKKAAERVSELKTTVKSIYGENMDEGFKENWLAFMEVSTFYRGNGARRQEFNTAVLNLKPIEVAPLMSSLIFGKIRSVHLVSATMQTMGNFNYMKRQLGCPAEIKEFVGPSPFDFMAQAKAYYPSHLPTAPKESGDPFFEEKMERYMDAMTKEIVQLIEIMEGRTLVLFTNTAHMNDMHERVAELVNYTCLLQGGGMTKHQLIETMKEDHHSCLFATRSFFSGVDIPGAALSCVALVKAPFPNTGDPLFKARAAKIKGRGGDDFNGLSLPLMIFELKQAFGRLIRTTDDEGVFAFLDSRTMGQSYWGKIEASLPKMKKFRRLA